MAKKKTVVRKKAVAKSKGAARKATRGSAPEAKRQLSQLKTALKKTNAEALANIAGAALVEPVVTTARKNNMIEGDLTIYHAARMKENFLAKISENGNIEIDLSQVTEIDTAGFQLMIMTQRECKKTGKSLRFINPSEAVRDLLKTYRANAMFGL